MKSTDFNRTRRDIARDYGQDAAAPGAGERADPSGANHNRGVNAAVNVERLATAALGAGQALPVASTVATLGTAAGQSAAGGGKVTPVRYEHGRSHGSGQEENAAHFRARSR